MHGLLFGKEPQLLTWVDLLVNLGALALTLAIAAASWTFFEKRILDWGRRSFKYKKASSAPLYPEGQA